MNEFTEIQRRNIDVITHGLDLMNFLQETGASNLPPQLRATMDRADFTAACFGAVAEIVEVAEAAGWKPWRREEYLNEEQLDHLAEEVGDVFHFISWCMRNIEQRYGLTTLDFARGFMRAHLKNVARFMGQVPGREPPPDPTIYDAPSASIHEQ
jgi:NTP pyrophosphatase (non-canonical NTP hydrolase)